VLARPARKLAAGDTLQFGELTAQVVSRGDTGEAEIRFALSGAALDAALMAKGVTREAVTLHVGLGTFLPVTAEDTAAHVMHAERATLDGATAARLNGVHAAGGRIAAVGTTSLRTLESAAGPDGT